MRLAVSSIFVCLALAAASLAARATPFSYSESVSGDLPEFSTSAFALDVGSNTIQGTTHFTAGEAFDVDSDNFAFVVPSGTSLSSISFAFATTAVNGAVGASIGFGFAPQQVDNCSSNPLCGFQEVNLLGPSPVNLFSGTLPAASGSYGLFEEFFSLLSLPGAENPSWSTDYTWTLNVVSSNVISEPGSLALIGLGITGLVLVRGRKAARAGQRA